MSDTASLLCAYTFIWNVLAMSSCSIPVTVTREDEQFYESHWDDDITTVIKKTVSDSVGLPVNVQIVGLPFTEERVLGLAKKIEDHFQFLQKHPFPQLWWSLELSYEHEHIYQWFSLSLWLGLISLVLSLGLIFHRFCAFILHLFKKNLLYSKMKLLEKRSQD